MKNDKTHQQNQHNEEFGPEFGDINEAKFYETPFLNAAQKEKIKSDKDCKNRH